MFVFILCVFLSHCNVSTSVFNVHAYTCDMCTNKDYLLTYLLISAADAGSIGWHPCEVLAGDDGHHSVLAGRGAVAQWTAVQQMRWCPSGHTSLARFDL